MINPNLLRLQYWKRRKGWQNIRPDTTLELYMLASIINQVGAVAVYHASIVASVNGYIVGSAAECTY